METIKFFDNKFQDILSSELQFMQLNAKEVQEADTQEKSWISNPDNLTCSYCRVEFTNTVDQREHYKLDWHRYNIKQSLLSRQSLTEDEFLEKADDVSSISGSDTEDDEAEKLESIAISQGKLFIKNTEGTVFSMYRCLLYEKRGDIDTNTLRKVLKNYALNLKWTVLMLGGGHFAGAIYHGNKPILHKTFHSYTVRSGQGGGQSAKDNRGGCSKSAGSSLRRYNEQTYIQHIGTLLESWKSEIAQCSLIIYRAAGNFNRNTLFGGKTPPLDRSDCRLRTVPFSTRRPTFAELKRVFECLTTVHLYDSFETIAQTLPKQIATNTAKRSKANIHRSKSRETVSRPLPNVPLICGSSEEELRADQIDLFLNQKEISFKNDLQECDDSLTPEERKRGRRKSKPKKIKDFQNSKKKETEIVQKPHEIFKIIEDGDLKDFEIHLEKLQHKLRTSVSNEEKNVKVVDAINEVLDENSNTLLHVAVLHQQMDIIDYLLTHNADPCKKNNKLQTPYTCTQNKKIREVFKDFAQEFPEKYNYNKANIPTTTLSKEEQMEKEKLKKKAKREKEKERKKVNAIKEKEKEEQQRYLNLSDREKRALAAERRIISQSGTVVSRCFLCALDISGKVPFEYCGNRFCSMDCLKAHRMKTPNTLS